MNVMSATPPRVLTTEAVNANTRSLAIEHYDTPRWYTLRAKVAPNEKAVL